MDWIEVSLTVKRAAIPAIAALLNNCGGNGITEEYIDEEYTKLSWYTSEFLSVQEASVFIENILKENLHLTSLNYELNCMIIDEETWMNGWQRYIQPIEILPNLVIKPAWQEYERKDREKIIQIDSELSFGTGDHETTQSCAKLLGVYAPQYKGTFLDIGTGTGILLLIAATFNFAQLIGIDIDKSAIEQAEKNCDLNNIVAELICGNLSDDFDGKADFIMANLTVDPLKILLPVIGKKLAKNGILIISGIVDERYNEIMPYILESWQIKEHIKAKNWHTFALVGKNL